MKQMKLGFFGCGNMGEAFLKSIVAKEVFLPRDITVCNREAEKNERLAKVYGVNTTLHAEDLETCDYLILGFKPQNLAEISFTPKQGMVVISMLAGKTIEKIEDRLLNTKIVRIMPNLGQFTGYGVTGVVFHPTMSFAQTEKDIVRDIVESGGKMLLLPNEEKIDQLSTISGSGPAYFFLFAEKLVQAAKKYGFTDTEADILVRQTFLGSAEIAKQNPSDSFADWRKKVTSPKGTTEQAIRIFEEKELGEIVEEAALAALKRTEELAQES